MLTNAELVDTLITDCNNAVRSCVGGQYIAFCNTMVQMVQKLANLKVGIQNDLKNREEVIATLENQLREAGLDVKRMTIGEVAEMVGEKDG